MRTRVKICGITRRQDAEFAVEIGVDAIGLVFYPPSPRAVTVAQASEIIAQLPPFVTVVGLFVDATVAEVNHCCDLLPLNLLQFHGDETAEFCEQFDRPYIKAIRMREGISLPAQATDYASASGLLLDSYQLDLPGGTGQTFDWARVSDIGKPLILAGGLNEHNIARAIRTVRPYAVDVSGGVELAKGIKSNDKMSAFMREVVNG